MTDPKPMPYSLLKGGEKTLDTASIQSAIRVLGISQDQTAELQGYIKRRLSEERSGARNPPVELLVIQEFQHEWCIWGKERLIQTRDAIRECITALRLGIPLIQPQRPLTPSGSASSQPSVGTEELQGTIDDTPARSPIAGIPHAEDNDPRYSDLNNGRPGLSTRDTPTQTQGVHSEKDPGGYHIKHLRGLHHEFFEIRDVPGGNPRLVVVENSPYLPLSAVECAADEDNEDSPILGDKLLPAPTIPPHLAGREPVPCQPPHLPVLHDYIERARSGAGDRMQTMCELLYEPNSFRALGTHPLHNRPLGLGLVKTPPAPEELTCVNMPSHQLNDTAGPQGQPCSPPPITDTAPSHPTSTLNPTQRRPPRAEAHPRPATYPNETTIVRRGALKQRRSSTPHPHRALNRSASDNSSPVPSPSQSYTPPSQLPTHSNPNTDDTTTTGSRRRLSPFANPPMTMTASASASATGPASPQPHHHNQQQHPPPYRIFSSSAP